MPEIIHNIDLSAIEHRPGQSTDLEAKRQRAWSRLSDEEKEWVIAAWDLTGMIPSAPAFRELKSAGDRVLYVLVGTEESLTPLELCYLMIARWFRNIDPATARAKMAQLVNQGYARYTGIGRTMGTEAGLDALEELRSRRPRQSDDDDEEEEGRSDHRQTTSRTRIVDRGESPKSNFGNRGAPSGRYRSEIPYDGGRPKRRDDRREDSGDSRDSRDDRGSIGDYRGRDSRDSRGAPRDNRSRYDDRGPRRDDRDSRGRDDRGPRRDARGDRGGYSGGGGRRDDRGGGGGGYSRGPRRDDRGGDSRGGGGGYSRGPRRDDRGGGGGYSRGPRRDDRGGDSRGRGRNDRGGSPERGRVNTDGPVIDGNQPQERRINNDGPVIDGRDKNTESSSND